MAIQFLLALNYEPGEKEREDVRVTQETNAHVEGRGRAPQTETTRQNTLRAVYRCDTHIAGETHI